MEFKGIFCPVVTPFYDDRIALSSFQSNIEKLNEAELAGYVVFGSTGEFVHVDDAEKLDVIQLARKLTPPNKRLIVGSGKESTSATIDFTAKVADLGADFALIVTPRYYRNQHSNENLIGHYQAVADRSPIPILLYNVPVFTAVDLPVPVITELSLHPNIVGIKDSTTSIQKIIQLVEGAAKDFSILIGNVGLFWPGLLAGAEGAILAVCNIAFNQAIKIHQLLAEGQHSQAQKEFIKLLKLSNNVVSKYGIPGIKTAMSCLGFDGGEPRRPLTSPDPSAANDIRQQLEKLELLQ